VDNYERNPYTFVMKGTVSRWRRRRRPRRCDRDGRVHRIRL